MFIGAIGLRDAVCPKMFTYCVLLLQNYNESGKIIVKVAIIML